MAAPTVPVRPPAKKKVREKGSRKSSHLSAFFRSSTSGLLAENLPPRVGLRFTGLPEEDRRTHLAHLVCDAILPLAIHLTKNYSKKDCDVALKKGDKLLLCFVDEFPTVQASFSKEHEYRLPIHASQLYEKLPIDARLDDKEYLGTKALIEAKPLPEQVRVVDAHFSADPMASQDVNDVITVQRVEIQDHPDRGRERVVVGTDPRGVEVHYSEAMDMASYTTMIAGDLLPMSELVRYDMPQRVRLPEIDKMSKRNKAKEKVMKLHRYFTDYHVIATRADDSNILLSIPLNTPLEFELTDINMKDLEKMLPPLLSRVNPTWAAIDVSHPKLPESFRSIPQPLEGVLNVWANSYEGKERMSKGHQSHVFNLKQIIDDGKREISILKRNLSPHASSEKPSLPPRGSLNLDIGSPPVPPRQEPETSQRRASLPPPIKQKPSLPPKKNKPPNNQEYNELFDAPTSSASAINYDKTIHELKLAIHQKDQEIFTLRQTKARLKQSYEAVCRERDQYKLTTENDRKEILKLQTMIDRLYDERNPTDGNLYQTLDEPTQQTDVYSLPVASRKIHKDQPIEAIGDFLREIGLNQYCDVFEKEGIDGLMLLQLDEQIMMEDLKMRRLDARKLKAHIIQRS